MAPPFSGPSLHITITSGLFALLPPLQISDYLKSLGEGFTTWSGDSLCFRMLFLPLAPWVFGLESTCQEQSRAHGAETEVPFSPGSGYNFQVAWTAQLLRLSSWQVAEHFGQ